jgi:hypothetical protein
MRKIIIDHTEQDAEDCQECPLDHTPNVTTIKALEQACAKKGLKRVDSVEDLFKQLSE